jgi:hypothetical protein
MSSGSEELRITDLVLTRAPRTVVMKRLDRCFGEVVSSTSASTTRSLVGERE